MQIEGLSPDPADKAAQAMRARCYQRFSELHTERQDIETQINGIDNTPARDPAACHEADVRQHRARGHAVAPQA